MGFVVFLENKMVPKKLPNKEVVDLNSTGAHIPLSLIFLLTNICFKRDYYYILTYSLFYCDAEIFTTLKAVSAY